MGSRVSGVHNDLPFSGRGSERRRGPRLSATASRTSGPLFSVKTADSNPVVLVLVWLTTRRRRDVQHVPEIRPQPPKTLDVLLELPVVARVDGREHFGGKGAVVTNDVGSGGSAKIQREGSMLWMFT